MEYKNMKQFCERYNQCVETPDSLSLSDHQFMQFYKTELAMALLKDLGDIGKEVAKTMIFLCELEGVD